MLIVTYDITDDKLRRHFAKYLSKFGYRLQFSVFQIKHTQTVLNNVKLAIDSKFVKRFAETDSVIIFDLSQTCKKYSFGYARHDDSGYVMI